MKSAPDPVANILPVDIFLAQRIQILILKIKIEYTDYIQISFLHLYLQERTSQAGKQT